MPREMGLDLCPHGSLAQGCLELLPVGSCCAAPQCICSCRWNFFVSSPQRAAGLTKGEVEHKQGYSEYQVPILGATWCEVLNWKKTSHTHLLCFLWCFLCVSDVIYSSFLAPASFWDGQEHLQELGMSTSQKALLSVRWKSLATYVPL